ncbi:MAG: GNAT family N-acetyltransferase [Firmicutes bacterium]|nr:GNAT family N-acetyltransferase [Alicyclobacillaceae bacterium]MCL6497275.1 GNAT family N-acetyltransferase [Bacillota bacterium]
MTENGVTRLPVLPAGYRGYRVGFATLRDLWAIGRLERVVFLEPMPWAALWQAWRHPRARWIVVRDRSRLAAYFGFEVVGGFAHVFANVTHPRYRRQGLARFLLTAAEPVAEDLGAGAFVGEVRAGNRAQLHLLQTIGWQVIGRRPHFFKNGEDALLVFKPFFDPLHTP